jgi:16S rRNA (guanine527-N7)-methyltransferase
VKLDFRSILEALSPAQREQLEQFESLLVEKAVPLGYVGASDRSNLRERHVYDSLRALGCIGQVPLQIIDVGSGAGLPGVPLAITRPDCAVWLIEPSVRRAAFLELAIEALGLENAEVVIATGDDADLLADAVVARALAGPLRTWAICSRLARPTGFVLYFAGRSWRESGPRELAGRQIEWEVCVESEFPWQGPIVKMLPKRPSA